MSMAEEAYDLCSCADRYSRPSLTRCFIGDAGDGRNTVLTRLLFGGLPLYSFNSFFSSVRKRQSVCSAMIFCGVDSMTPASCRRSA